MCYFLYSFIFFDSDKERKKTSFANPQKVSCRHLQGASHNAEKLEGEYTEWTRLHRGVPTNTFMECLRLTVEVFPRKNYSSSK